MCAGTRKQFDPGEMLWQLLLQEDCSHHRTLIASFGGQGDGDRTRRANPVDEEDFWETTLIKSRFLFSGMKSISFSLLFVS